MTELTEEEKKAQKEVAEETKKAQKEAKKVVLPKKFSEVPFKGKLVIKNANGTETQVNKAYWQTVRNAELDRLQGIQLLGLYVPKEDGSYEVAPIEDDSEVGDL